MASSQELPLQNWLKASGAAGLDSVELADFSVTGRGLKALRHFKKGETILTVPDGLLWTVEKAYSDPLLGPALRSAQPPLSVDDTLVIFILFVRSRESDHNDRRTHVSALPTSYSSSIFFTEEELEVCAGSSLYTITKQLEQQIEDDYRNLVRQLIGVNQDLFPLEKFTIEDYKWALCTVWSRAMDFRLADSRSLRLMVPFVDMLNHSPEVGQCHAYDTSSGAVSILAGKEYEIGDQVFIYYGSIPNNRLLRLYGFVVPGNVYDSYDLVLSTHPSAPLFEEKQKLWALAGLDSVLTIPLTLTDPLPKSVLRYLRIQRLDDSDLTQVSFEQTDIADKKINHKNETEILQFLISSIDYHLEKFGIQLERLEEQLANNTYSLGGNAWAAAQVSLGEQRVLRLAKDSAEGLLKAVKSDQEGKTPTSAGAQCANCGATDHLKLCARCKGVAYCQRECQVAHYPKHKAVCRGKTSS